MSVSFTNSQPSPAHPIDQPEIASKIQAFNELVAKVRRMEPITLFCISEEHDSGSGMGSSTYTYTYYTNQENANQHRLGLFDKSFVMPAVRDEYRDIYKVSFETTLELTKLNVKRHFEEQQLFEIAQNEKQQCVEKMRLLAQRADLDRKLAQWYQQNRGN